MVGLFEGAAAYYARYRPGYPDAAVNAVVDSLNLPKSGSLLDLGCGTGQLAIPFRARGISVYAVDPDVDMLRAGLAAEDRARVGGIAWMRGDDKSLSSLPLPCLGACVMGASFHWMERDRLLRDLDGMIGKAGGIAIFSDKGGIWSDDGLAWQSAVKKVVQEFLGEERRAGQATYCHPKDRHEDVVRRSRFSEVEILEFKTARDLSIDDIVGFQLSTSYASPAQLGDGIERFKDKLRAELTEFGESGRLTDYARTEVIIGRR